MRVLLLLRQALRTFRGDESGQSLIVIVSAMTVLLVVAAFALDTANWMVRHHDAQVVADSAALAAAQCLANPNQPATIDVNGTTETLTPCGSSTDADLHAQDVAVAYAAANGITIQRSAVTFSGKVVTVSASTDTPTVFARVMGIGTATQSAQAGAGFSGGSNQCTTPGAATCDFMFAHDENCAGGVTAGVDIQVNGNSSVSGNIQSNGNLTVQSNGNPSWGNGSYGPSSNGSCSSIDQYNGHDPWSAPPTQDTVNYPYPIDYSTDFPACTDGGGSNPCQTSSGLAPGYPSFCTNGSTNITLDGSTAADTAKTHQIYCAYGTGVKSNPSTWNGTIAITLQDNQTTTLDDTFVGGSISFSGSGKDDLSSCGYSLSGFTASNCDSSVPSPSTPNYPIFYATGKSSTALDIQVSGSQTFNGDMFAPSGGASIQMNGNKSLTTFIEANDISGQVNGTLQGDGPAAGSLGNPTGGAVSLVQ